MSKAVQFYGFSFCFLLGLLMGLFFDILNPELDRRVSMFRDRYEIKHRVLPIKERVIVVNHGPARVLINNQPMLITDEEFKFSIKHKMPYDKEHFKSRI